ncbi:hypothetical protein [Rhizobium sp. HT1-10]|uniref:hypothetical protein n=1 Tax=Rhizobium sp. HT1-10 TaxID=3111638 RepID=UPI003C19A887
MVTFTWLKDYQDAFSGMATLLAAIVAYAAVRWQVRSEARSKRVEQQRRLRNIMHLIAVEFDIAAAYLKNRKRTWNGSDLAVIDQLAVEIVSYDANMLELAKRARTLISEFAPTDIKAAELMALAAHEAFLQAGNEQRPPESRRGYFDSATITIALGGGPTTDIKDLRHYFKWV